MNASSQDRLREADRLLDEIGQFISRTAPALSPLFTLWAGEAKFGRALIDRDLRRLGPGAGILEVGAGSFMLSCILQREGFRVTALEPTGGAFSHFTQLQAFVLDHAARDGMAPTVLAATGETLALEGQFDFAFSRQRHGTCARCRPGPPARPSIPEARRHLPVRLPELRLSL